MSRNELPLGWGPTMMKLPCRDRMAGLPRDVFALDASSSLSVAGKSQDGGVGQVVFSCYYQKLQSQSCLLVRPGNTVRGLYGQVLWAYQPTLSEPTDAGRLCEGLPWFPGRMPSASPFWHLHHHYVLAVQLPLNKSLESRFRPSRR